MRIDSFDPDTYNAAFTYVEMIEVQLPTTLKRRLCLCTAHSGNHSHLGRMRVQSFGVTYFRLLRALPSVRPSVLELLKLSTGPEEIGFPPNLPPPPADRGQKSDPFFYGSIGS